MVTPALATQWLRPRVAAPLCSVGPRARRYAPLCDPECFCPAPENFAVKFLSMKILKFLSHALRHATGAPRR